MSLRAARDIPISTRHRRQSLRSSKFALGLVVGLWVFLFTIIMRTFPVRFSDDSETDCNAVRSVESGDSMYR